ncbi:hypothetical protein [Streptomyces antarcticus]|uniref:hypothetical protein n=1 Tax=Streptomyces antarcticus TaxID=2996458 RepID=UPI002271D0F7|nr:MULTISPECIES: hypothetical protein [unclassified Streptomyces]MCY0947296.1 hypothetical protein [Streptomyces sp. H34-AA3]MCZ4086541.1 hypothetical protein [Streptomyces sp. H34-S5]
MSKNTIRLERGIYVYESLEIAREQVSDSFIKAYEGGSLTNVIEDLARDMGTTPEEIDARPGWTQSSRSDESDDYEIYCN